MVKSSSFCKGMNPWALINSFAGQRAVRKDMQRYFSIEGQCTTLAVCLFIQRDTFDRAFHVYILSDPHSIGHAFNSLHPPARADGGHARLRREHSDVQAVNSRFVAIRYPFVPVFRVTRPAYPAGLPATWRCSVEHSHVLIPRKTSAHNLCKRASPGGEPTRLPLATVHSTLVESAPNRCIFG